ncbi:MAG: hypothetical protein LAP39_06920 [Acidobacteriia bacterium]|nr:hypothetical protein [Terriglobia bacterium]
MLKKIGLSSAALFAVLTCIQPASLFAGGRDDYRNSRYADARREHEERESHERIERLRRDRDDRDHDRDWRRDRHDDDAYRYQRKP